MSHVPFEYSFIACSVLSVLTAAAASLVVPDLVLTVGVASFVIYWVAYAYSPLPQGPTAPNHMGRKRKWGFRVEHKRDQTKLKNFNDR